MGNCKDQLTPSNPPPDPKKDSKLGFFPKRNKGKEEDAPKKLADYILKSDDILDQLIDEKSKEVEKSSSEKEVKKRGLLKLMRYHVQEVIDLAQEYHDL